MAYPDDNSEDVFDIAERSDEDERPPPTDLNGFNITNNDDKLRDDVTRSRRLPSSGGGGGGETQSALRLDRRTIFRRANNISRRR